MKRLIKNITSNSSIDDDEIDFEFEDDVLPTPNRLMPSLTNSSNATHKQMKECKKKRIVQSNATKKRLTKLKKTVSQNDNSSDDDFDFMSELSQSAGLASPSPYNMHTHVKKPYDQNETNENNNDSIVINAVLDTEAIADADTTGNVVIFDSEIVIGDAINADDATAVLLYLRKQLHSISIGQNASNMNPFTVLVEACKKCKVRICSTITSLDYASYKRLSCSINRCLKTDSSDTNVNTVAKSNIDALQRWLIPFMSMSNGEAKIKYITCDNHKKYATSPLLYALRYCHLDIVQMLCSLYPEHAVKVLSSNILLDDEYFGTTDRESPPLIFNMIKKDMFMVIPTALVAINNKLNNSTGSGVAMVSYDSSNSQLITNPACLKLLHIKYQQDYSNVLHWACEEGLDECVHVLLQLDSSLANDADINGMLPIHSACLMGSLEAVKVLTNFSSKVVTDACGWGPFLYSLFKERIDCALFILQDLSDNVILSQLNVLNAIIETPRDTRLKGCLEAIGTIPEFNALLNMYIRNNVSLLEHELSWVLKYPFLLSIDNKIAIARLLCMELEACDEQGLDPITYPILHRTMYDVINVSLPRGNPWLGFINMSDGVIDIHGRRAHTSSIVAKASQKNATIQYLRYNLIFQITNEIGIGKGVEREVIESMRKCMTDSTSPYCIFVQDAASDTYYPKLISNDFHCSQSSSAPLSTVSVKSQFVAFGHLLGHFLLRSFAEGNCNCFSLLSIGLSRLFWKIVLIGSTGGKSVKVTLEDLADMDAYLYQNLLWMKENDNVHELDITFTAAVANDICAVGRKGYRNNIIDLIPKGASVAVTDENKHIYIAKMIKHCTVDRMETQALHVREGILNVIPNEVFNLFRDYELGVIVAPLITDIDIDDWRGSVQYNGYDDNDVIIQSFWTLVKGLSSNEKGLLLSFSTGCSRAPIGGFHCLTPKFNITRVTYHQSHSLPTAATCFNMLKLPHYPSTTLLRKNVLTAILYGSEGFTYT